MGIAATHSITNHTQSVITNLRSKDELPFTEVLSTDSVNGYLSDIPCRNRMFTPALTLFGFLSQAIGADQSCQAAVSKIIAHMIGRNDRKPPSANTAAYCKARARLPEHVLSALTKECGQQLEEQAEDEWLWRGRHVKLVDGSTISMPDTLKNQKVYPQPNTQKKGSAFQ